MLRVGYFLIPLLLFIMATKCEPITGPHSVHTLIVTVDETKSWELRSDSALRPQIELIFREYPNLQDRECGRGNITCIEELIEERFKAMTANDLQPEADSAAQQAAARVRAPASDGSGSTRQPTIEPRAKTATLLEGHALTFFVNGEPVELRGGPALRSQVGKLL